MKDVSNAVIQFLASSKTRVLILALLVLTTGVFTTVYLLGEQQDIRQRASFEPNSQIPNDYIWKTVSVGELGTYLNNGGKFWQSVQNSNGSTSYQIGVPTQTGTGSSGTFVGEQSWGTTTQTQSTYGGIWDGTYLTPAPADCASCLSKGKKYRCPNFFGGYTCENYNWGVCSECKPSSTPTPSPLPTLKPTEIPKTPTLKPTKIPKTPTPPVTVITSPFTPTPPVPTIDPRCAQSTGKANGCACAINVHCASGFCELTSLSSGICANPEQPNPTVVTLTCDPNKDGVIDILDFQWWKDEAITKVRTTAESDCFNPDGIVNLADFQVWKDIAVTKVRQPF